MLTTNVNAAMQELYSNYTDISFDMDEENNPKTMTLEQYNSIMKEAKENLDDREQQIEIDLKNRQVESADSLLGIGTRAIMPYTYAGSVNAVVYGANVSIVFQYSVQGFTYQDTVNQLVAQSFSL